MSSMHSFLQEGDDAPEAPAVPAAAAASPNPVPLAVCKSWANAWRPKYPLDRPATAVIEKVAATVEASAPSTYEEQGAKRGRKKAELPEGEAVDPDQVMEGLEDHCLREARRETAAEDNRLSKQANKRNKKPAPAQARGGTGGVGSVGQ